MSFFMTISMASLGEGFETVLALEWLYASVGFLMSFFGIFPGKIFVAELALVRFQTYMRVLMPLFDLLGGENQIAELANMW